MIDRHAALLIIDMQMVMQHRVESGRPNVNGDKAPGVVEGLADAFRANGRPVIHVRHADTDASSPLHPAAAGYPAMACAREAEGESVFVKSSSSAFATTALADHLRAHRIDRLFMCGAVAGFCVNSTVRTASDLGFAVTVVQDAVIGFDLPATGLDAGTIFAVTMGLLKADFARVVQSAEVLGEGIASTG